MISYLYLSAVPLGETQIHLNRFLDSLSRLTIHLRIWSIRRINSVSMLHPSLNVMILIILTTSLVNAYFAVIYHPLEMTKLVVSQTYHLPLFREGVTLSYRNRALEPLWGWTEISLILLKNSLRMVWLKRFRLIRLTWLWFRSTKALLSSFMISTPMIG